MAYPEKGIARRKPSAWLEAQCRAEGGLVDDANEAQASLPPSAQEQDNSKFNLRTEDGLAAAKQKLQAIGLSPTITISPSTRK